MNDLISNPAPPVIVDERQLERDDLNRLPDVRGVGTKRLQKIRAVHHRTAQLAAAGMSNVAIAASVGMNPDTIGHLRNDPAFQELLAHYQEMEKELWKDVREKAATLGITAVEELQARLLDNPDSVPTKALLEIMQSGLDYGGHKSEQKNIHLHTTPDELARIKAGARESSVRVREADDGGDHRGDPGDGDEPGDSEEGEIIEGEARRA